VEVCSSLDELLLRDDIEAVALATPVSSHFPLGLKALEAGKHLLIEKPFTLTVADAETLIEASVKRSLTLMVDHTFIYNASVRKDQGTSRQWNDRRHTLFDSVRVNLGLFQRDTNVDLGSGATRSLDNGLPDPEEPHRRVGNGNESFRHDGRHRLYHGHVPRQHYSTLSRELDLSRESPEDPHRRTKLMVSMTTWNPVRRSSFMTGGWRSKETDSVYKALVEYRTGDMFASAHRSNGGTLTYGGGFRESHQNGTRPESDAQSGTKCGQITGSSGTSRLKWVDL